MFVLCFTSLVTTLDYIWHAQIIRLREAKSGLRFLYSTIMSKTQLCMLFLLALWVKAKTPVKKKLGIIIFCFCGLLFVSLRDLSLYLLSLPLLSHQYFKYRRSIFVGEENK